jgi:hypothetical protein
MKGGSHIPEVYFKKITASCLHLRGERLACAIQSSLLMVCLSRMVELTDNRILTQGRDSLRETFCQKLK